MNDKSFALERKDNGGITHILLAGDIDIYAAPFFKSLIIEAISDGQKLIIVDLTKTVFIDSTALGVLISGYRRLEPVHGRLVLVTKNEIFLNIFQITGLDNIFPIFPNTEEAEADLNLFQSFDKK